MEDYPHQEDNNNTIQYYSTKDIELKLLFCKYCDKINSISNISDEVKEYNKTILKGIILAHCENNKINFETRFLILIYSNSTPIPDPYFMYLSYLLCSIEEYEATEYLNHHFLNYTYNQQDFLGRIINYVIEQTQRVMPINNYSLREKIMNWAKLKNAQLISLTNDNLIVTNTKNVSSIETIITDDLPLANKTLYYWEKDIKKLQKLYDILLEENMIEPNENFIKSFSEFNVLHKYSTIWNNGETSLFALLYLLYDKQRTYNDINKETLAVVSNKLFIIKGKKTNAKNTYQNFTNFLNKTNSADYFPKKHKDILAIYQKI